MRRLFHQTAGILVSGVCLAGFLLWAASLPARASLVLNRSDILSRDLVSASANHEIHFKTVSGVSAPTHSIVLTWSAPFSGLGALSAADLNLFHGTTTGFENSDSVATSAGVNVWGFSVAGQSITLTPPTNAAPGTIAANQFVVIRLGTNTPAGTHQITNPDHAGVYQVSLSGGFGDTGSILIPITNNDIINVTATIVSPPSPPVPPGGGGSLPGQNPTIVAAAPVMGQIRVMNIGGNGVDIQWTTDRASDSRVSYGTDPGNLSVSSVDLTSGTSHLVHLTGLSVDTGYTFIAYSKDRIGNVSNSPPQTFRTAHAPLVNSLRLVSATESSAVISWDTDEPAGGSGFVNPSGAFGTPSDTGTSHTLTFTELTPSTTYAAVILSRDTTSGLTTQNTLSFSTLIDHTAPSNVSEFTATEQDQAVALTWRNPTSDPHFASVMIRRRSERYPAGLDDGELVYQGTDESAFDDGVVSGGSYLYTAFSLSPSGVPSSGALAEIDLSAPQGNTAPAQPTTRRRSGSRPRSRPRTQPAPPPPTPIAPVPQPQPIVPGSTTAPSAAPAPLSTANPSLAGGAGIIPGFSGSSSSPDILLPTTSSPQAAGDTIHLTPTGGLGSGVVTSSLAAPSALVSEQLAVSFFLLPAGIELEPESSGEFLTPARQPVLARISVTSLRATPDSAVLDIGGARYAFAQNAQGTAWEARFVPSSNTGAVKSRIIFHFASGTTQENTRHLRILPGGRVLEADPLGSFATPLAGARVTLLGTDGSVLALDGQSNPVTTAKQGGFVFVVPNGNYQLVVTKNGYREARRSVSVTHGFVAEEVVLKKVPLALSQVIDPHASLGHNALAVLADTGLVVGAGLDVIQTPANQAAANHVVAPAVVTLAVASSASGVSAFNAFNYIYFLVTQPLLLIKRRKRQTWGVVYHALSKLPLELVIVRLLRAENGVLVQTRITDAQGRYSFLAKPGRYRLEVIKPGLIFPTALLKDEKQDVDFVDLYHGETIEVKQDSVIAVNVPLDPLAREDKPRRILLKQALRKIQDALGFASVVITSGALIVAPSPLLGALLLGQIGTYLVFRRLSVPPKPKGWGFVQDETSHRPLERTVVRIFDKKFNKLLETQITSKTGQYGFFVGKNTYYVTAEHAGYARYLSPDIDLTKQAAALVDQSIKLKPESA